MPEEVECAMVNSSELDASFQSDIVELEDKHEFKSNSLNSIQSISVKGRLRKCISAWKDINAPKFIIDVIEQGYKIPLLYIPEAFKGCNNSSALKEYEFVEQAINELLSLGCISEVPLEPDIINPLSVSIQKSGKKRLILDLRHVNKCIFKNKFRCEDISIAKEI